jgi:guanylate kinase
VVSGPSGAGKTSLCKALLKSLRGIECSISYTTRSAREGEEEGKDYYFVDTRTFERMIREGAFLEWAEVHGHTYGTSERTIRERKKNLDFLLEVDCKGAAQIKGKLTDAILVFIMTPSVEDLIRRIRKRGPISDEDFVKRMETARNEIEQLSSYDYLLINARFSEALEELHSIILAERCRIRNQATSWMKQWIDEISRFRKG